MNNNQIIIPNDSRSEVIKRVSMSRAFKIIFDPKYPRFHPDALGNYHLKNGEVEYFYHVSGKIINHVCPFHPTKNANGNNIKFKEFDDEGNPMDTSYICRTTGCKYQKIWFNNVIDMWMVLVKNVPIDELYLANEEFLESLQELCEIAGIPYNAFSSGSKHFSEEEKELYLISKSIDDAIELYHENLLDSKSRFSVDALNYFLYTRAFLSIYITDELIHEVWEECLNEQPNLTLEEVEKWADELQDNIKNDSIDSSLSSKPIKKMIETKARENALVFIKKQKIGYAPGKKGWTWVYNRLKTKYSDDILLKAGIVGKDENSGEIYDRYFGRITIKKAFKGKSNNIYGRSTWKEGPKELRHFKRNHFTPTPLNYDIATRYILVGLVEGEFDLETLLALGFENFMESGGTNGFNEELIDDLVSIRDNSTQNERCKKFILAGDEDLPGQTSNIEIGRRLRKRGFEVRVMLLTEGDINKHVQLYGYGAKEKIQELIDKSISYEAFFILFSIETLPKQTFLEKKAAMTYIRPYVECLPADETLFVAKEVAFKLGEPKEFADYLLTVWGILPKQKLFIGFDEAKDHPSVILTKSEKIYQYMKMKFHQKNTVLIRNHESFMDELTTNNEKSQLPLHNLVLDNSFSVDEINYYVNSLPNYKFYKFDIAEEQIDDMTLSQLKNHFKKL